MAGLALPTVAPQPAQAEPPGTYAYVANFNDGTVPVINAVTSTVVATVPVEDLPFGVATGVVPRPALTLIKLTAGRTFTQGGQGAYSLTVTNTGDLR